MMQEEVWKEIPGYHGNYFASTLGRIKSVDMECFTHGVKIDGVRCPSTRTHRGKFLACRKPTKKGYLRVKLTRPDRSTSITLQWHRLIALTFLDNPDGRPQVNHKDGDKANNRVDNLEWCTNAENRAHACSTGLQACGEHSGRNKLDNGSVIAILGELLQGSTIPVLARKYGVTTSCIRDIRDRKSWKHLSLSLVANPR